MVRKREDFENDRQRHALADLQSGHRDESYWQSAANTDAERERTIAPSGEQNETKSDRFADRISNWLWFVVLGLIISFIASVGWKVAVVYL